MLKRNKGITLIALVVTIIVLLILAGVTLSLVAGENGILKRATNAVDVNEKATVEEQADLLVADIATKYYEEKYVDNKEVGEMDDYIRKELMEEKETASGGYKVIAEKEENEIVVKVFKDGKKISEGILKDGKVEWSNDVGDTEDIIPEILANPTFNYDKSDNLESLEVKIVYPSYAKTKEYKIGEEGEWKTYNREIILVENNIIYARYMTRDGRNSDEVSETISNISKNILRYTNASSYLGYLSNDDAKIECVKYLFDKSHYGSWNLNSSPPF